MFLANFLTKFFDEFLDEYLCQIFLTARDYTCRDTNPLYDKRLSSELPVQYMKIPSSEHVENMGEYWENIGKNMLIT